MLFYLVYINLFVLIIHGLSTQFITILTFHTILALYTLKYVLFSLFTNKFLCEISDRKKTHHDSVFYFGEILIRLSFKRWNLRLPYSMKSSVS